MALVKWYCLAERTSDSAHDKPANQAAPPATLKERDEDQQQSVDLKSSTNLRAGTLCILAVLEMAISSLHLRFISLLHGKGGGHHLLNSARTIVVLHRLQNA